MARIATMWAILAEDSSWSGTLYNINYTRKYKITNLKEFLNILIRYKTYYQ